MRLDKINIMKIKYLFIFLIILFLGFSFQVAQAEDTGTKDLSVVELIVNPPNPAVNQLCSITIKVKNSGTLPMITGDGFNSYNYNFPDFERSRSVYPAVNNENRIESGATVNYYYEGKFLSAGNKNAFFTIDYGNGLSESSETNNTLNQIIKVMNQRDLDLAVASIVFDDDKPIVGEKINISVNVVNMSDVSLLASSSLELENNYSVDPYILKDVIYELIDFDLISFTHDNYPTFLKPLNKNGRINYNFFGSFNSVGTKKISFKVNKNFILPETHILNNLFSTSVVVYNDNSDRDSFYFSEPIIESISSTSALLLWNTDKPTIGRVDYRYDYFIDYTDYMTDNATTSHRFLIINLAPNTKYNYKISSTYNTITKESKILSLVTPLNDIIQNKTENNTVVDLIKNEQSQNIKTQNNTNSNSTSTQSVIVILIVNKEMYSKLKGKIILKVESKGEAYYVNPKKQIISFLSKPQDTLSIMRSEGVGISNIDLEKIPLGLINSGGVDTDKDGLPDNLETAIGTDINKVDSDGDGYSDKNEIENNFSPLAKNKKLPINFSFSKAQSGKILIQTQGRGEAWYVNPADNKRYFLGKEIEAFNLIKKLGVGISNKDFIRLTGK